MSTLQARTILAKEDESTVPGAAFLKKQAVKATVYRTAALAVFIAIAVGLLKSTIFFTPCVTAVACLYVASVAKIILAGRISGPVYSSLRAFAVTLFFTTFFTAPGLPPAAWNLGPSIFLLGTIGSVHITARAYSELAGVATRSLLIAAIGYLYYSLFVASGVTMLPEIGLVVLTGFVGTAAFTFVGIVSAHSDPRISVIGKAFAGLQSPVTAGTSLAAIVTYLVFVRPSLLVLGPLGITVAEWTAVCTAIVLMFLKIRSLMPRDDAPPFGSGHTVEGAISYEKGEIEKVAATVEEFVKTGKKDGLATLTMAVLLKNEVPPETVQKVVSVVVDYREDPEPPVLFKWALGDMDEARRKKRLAAVNEMMTAADAAVKATAAAVKSGNPGA